MSTTSRSAQLAVVTCTGCVLLLGLGLALVVIGWGARLPAGFVRWPGQAVSLLGAVGLAVMAGLMAARRPGNRYGWVWCGFAGALTVLLVARAGATLAVARTGDLDARLPQVVGLVGDVGWIAWLALFPFVLLLFPTGTVPTPRWRWVAWLAVVGAALMLGAAAFGPRLGIVPLDSPVGVAGDLGEVLSILVDVGVYLVFAAVVAAAVSLAARYRAAAGVERQQVLWFAWAAGVVGVSFLIDPFLEPPGVWDALYETAVLCLLYVAIGVAILGHGLYGIERVLDRTMVYVTLTACLLATYVLGAGYLGSIVGGGAETVVALLATGLVAVLFAPLRDRLQRAVDRLMHGEQTDPYAVLAELGHRLEVVLEPDEVPSTIVDTIAGALDLTQVELWVAEGGAMRLAAVHGTASATTWVPDTTGLSPSREDAMVLPLVHRGDTVGALVLAPRRTTGTWTAGERRLLADLAAQVGPAVHATALTAQLRSSLADLRRSREWLVAAQQEERLRIHRDLHDGLGPVLASLRLRLEACLDATQHTDADLYEELERLHELVGRATGDVRALVHDLHPPELAQLGLVGALEQHCERYQRDTGICVALRAGPVGQAPPAVQVALLRIAQEALVNVAKHAHAHRVELTLEPDHGHLRLSVSDDGIGIDQAEPGRGAGVASMRTRAELLGGTLRLCGTPGGGTRLTAEVPGRVER